MGCGKTTLAKRLSIRLGYDLVDLDQEIEQKIGQSIASYFEAHGEDAFRKLESETLKTFDYAENTIIATGGGAPCFFDNMEWMNVNGYTIYIEMPPAALALRLKNSKTKRPLLKDLDYDGLKNYVGQKLSERAPQYLKAKSTVCGLNLSVDDLRILILSNV